jgi:hypothetical protein
VPIIQTLIASQSIPVVGRLARQLLGLYAVDVPTTVKSEMTCGCRIRHRD